MGILMYAHVKSA